jgi:predicted Zn-dependent peptidase
MCAFYALFVKGVMLIGVVAIWLHCLLPLLYQYIITNKSIMPRTLYEYPNGFRIIYEKSKVKTPITSYNIICNFGSNNEPSPELYGSAHLIEHFCFKGSKKYKNLEISKYFDKIGAIFNAITTKKYTTYYTTCQDQFINHTLLLFSEMLLDPNIKNGEEYEREKNVVTEEALKSENDYIDIILNKIESIIYNGSPYAKPIDIYDFHKLPNHLPFDKVINLYKQYYVPQNMILSVVTNISFPQIKKIIDKTAFARHHHPLAKITNLINPAVLQPLSNQTPHITTIYKPDNKNYILSIGFKVDDYLNLKDYYSLKLLELILSDLKSSRIFTILREKNGLIYSSSTLVDSNERGAQGTFILITQMDPRNLYPSKKTKGVMLLIFDILENLLKNGVSNEELKIAKGHIKGHLISRLNNTNAISLLNGLDLLYDCNECVPMDKLYDTFYHKITCADIHSAIKRYITRDNMTIVLLGCDKTYPKLKPFIMRNLPQTMVTHK